jgi:parallel beta-helix repeat protein
MLNKCKLALIGLISFSGLLLNSCAAVRPVQKIENQVITGSVIWQGDIYIHGLVTVKKGARLELRPGTRVFFAPIDEDGDGIGDGEILVEGSLQALGTAEQPILLTSGAENPQPQDWKFLYLDFAKQVEIDHLIAEYAYSGVQIHFCKAKVTNSEFRYNIDGVRFSTANIELSGNLIHHNRHGIRYEERRGNGRVHHNQISDNQIGIFAVTRCENRTLFELNNLLRNRDYQVKLGIEQPFDLDFPRNWWGSLDAASLTDSFFDRGYDRTLGRVTASQPLSAPAESLGGK